MYFNPKFEPDEPKPVSVDELIKRNPITGKIEVSASITPVETFQLLLADGWGMWPTLNDAQKDSLFEHLKSKWKAADTIEDKFSKRAVKRYLASLLIDIKKGNLPKEVEVSTN